MKRIAYFSLILASVAFLFTACDDNKKKEDAKDSDIEVISNDQEVISEKEKTTSTKKDSNTIVITGTDQMKFDKTTINAKAGEKITILFKSVGKLAPEVMSHDLVVLEQGTTSREFGMEAAKAGGLDKMSADQKKPVIVATKMLAAGEEEEISFTLDKAGEYDFVCTFPGHFASMHGKIIVE